jgi:hypothetical protein
VPHLGSHHLPADVTHAAARLLATGAVSLLVAYGIVSLILVFTDDVPDSFVDLGVLAFAAAAVGWWAPRATGLVLVVSGGVIGPGVALLAGALGGTYASAAPGRLLALMFAVPVAAGLMLLAGGGRRAARGRGGTRRPRA